MLLFPADSTSQTSKRRSEGQVGKAVDAARASEATNKPLKASQELTGENSDTPVTGSEKLFFTKQTKLVKQINAFLTDQQLSHQH